MPESLPQQLSRELRLGTALDYVATWMTLEMVANEVRIKDFNPPAEFVDKVAAEMVCQPIMGWPDEDQARFYLSELWPDCAVLAEDIHA